MTIVFIEIVEKILNTIRFDSFVLPFVFFEITIGNLQTISACLVLHNCN